jgi:hypothetical protein
MELGYALGLTVISLSTFVAIWVNDTFNVGGQLSDLNDELPQH